MTYQAPMRDILFNVEHLSSWSQVRALPKYADVDQDDVEAALTGFSRFCSEVIAPLGRIGDEKGASFDRNCVTMPTQYEKAYQQYVDMGWQSLAHSVDFGGMGLPLVAGTASTEMLNSADMSFGLCPLLTNGAIDALQEMGSEKQKARYLAKLISGEWSGTMNLTEPQAGSDLGRIRCRAERHQDGTYKISGTKIFITYGEHDLSGNIIHLVLARTHGAPEGPKGLSLFVVPKFLEGTDGSHDRRNAVKCVSIEHKLGVRASPTSVLEYEGATGFLVGAENRGLVHMFVMMTSARFSVGIQGVAISENAYQKSLAYARDRVQGKALAGKSPDAVPIIDHPDVQRMLMRMRALTEGGRALAYATAGWIDLAKNGNAEQKPQADRIAEFLVPLVKGFCTETSVEVTSLGIQIHGGMGFIEETGIAQLYRDARILPIYEGTTSIQANDLLGRKILRDGGETARWFAEKVARTEKALCTGSSQAQLIADKLAIARGSFEESLAWFLKTAPHDTRAAFSAGVPFLMLAGNLAAGWQLGRSVLAAESLLQKETQSDFLQQKIGTAKFYMQHVLVECCAEKSRIVEGADSLLAGTFLKD